MEIEFIYSLLFYNGGDMGLPISVPGASLSAGLALSLLVALLLRGLTCPAEEATEKVQLFRNKKGCLKNEAPDSLLSDDRLVRRHF
jgi:hypothetical protein